MTIFFLELKAAIIKKKKHNIVFMSVFSFLEQWPEILYK